MRFRYVIFILLSLSAVFFGAIVAFDDTTRATTAGLPDYLAQNRYFVPQLAYFFTFFADRSLVVWQELEGNDDLWVYGVLAFVGTIMTAVAIRSAKRFPREKSRVQTLLRDLQQEKERAENLAKLKSEFLNHVSHELRTPLAVILGYLECMIDGLYGTIDAKHKEILTVVSKQSTDLQYMIDRLLVFSRLEAGKDQVRVEEFSLSQIVADLKPTFEFLARQKGIDMNWHVSPEVPMLRSDRERVREILNNLVQNAVKYTHHGSVSVQVQHLASTDSVSLEVADTGPGIHHAHLASIFDPFVQVHKNSSQNGQGGIGLGLSIVKKHLERLGGTIDLESELGKGTIFRITLPRLHEEERGRSRKARLLRLLRGRRTNLPPESPRLQRQA